MTNLRLMEVQGAVSATNSSSTPLGIGATFTGTAVEILNAGTVFVNVATDAASAVDGLSIQQSSDGVNWDHTDEYNVGVNSNKNYAINPHAQWLRVVYTNGAVAQTYFRLQTIVKGDAKPSSHRIADPINPQDDAELVKSIIELGDSASTDAFGRLRVSNPLTILEEKNLSVSPVLGNKGENGGTVTYQSQLSSFLLTSGISINGKATRQTRQRATYQPGKSQLIDITFTAGDITEVDTIQRIGYFDDNNGLFFEINGGDDIYFVVRSDTSGSPVDTKIPRASWGDPLDGSGVSGKVLDLTKSQILQIDFQWLGVGRVRFGFVIDGVPVCCYKNNWANLQAGVYMRNPNMPCRWQVENDGSTTGVSLEAICATVQSEGGFAERGLVLGFDNNGNGKAISAGAYDEVLAVRITADNIEKVAAFPVGASAICASAGDFLAEIWLNATGPTGGTWTQPAGSTLEQNVTRTGAYTGGVKVASFYAANQNSGIAAIKEAFSLIGLGYDIATDTADVVSIRIYAFTNETFYASLNIRQEA